MKESQARQILDYLHRRREGMVDLLSRLVEIESPSDFPTSQREIFKTLSDHFQALDYEVKRIPGASSAGMLYARPLQRKRGGPSQLLLGHSDTVWPLGTLRQMPIRRDERLLKGPGAFDMKAGLVQMIYALKALHELDFHPSVTPLVLINSDEETGSRDSQTLICRLARAASRVYVLEPSLGPSGKLKTARKGVGSFVIRIQGRSAHAGLEPEAGASAILELSYVIQKIYHLANPARGTTVNVGLVEGGLRPNVVAPESRAVVDVRVATEKEACRMEKQIRSLTPVTAGVSLAIQGRVGRPPLERTPRNRQLWELAKELGQHLSLQLEEGLAGGASDGNLTSLYTATLDGLGAVGGGAHARHEFVDLEKMPQRSALLALLLLAPPLVPVPERVKT
ncbi:MAG: M20 family metallopeptidase [Acidobacteriota bacterium]